MLPKLKILVFLFVLGSFIRWTESLNYKPKSKLKFVPGLGYQNILVAIGEDIEESRCRGVVEEIKSAMLLASSLLYTATNGAAFFGSVKILLPSTKCQNQDVGSPVSNALSSDSYEIADFKITNSNPLSSQLPYTRQYRGCSMGSEDVFLPINNFLLSTSLSSEERGKFLLHEWMKLRYGVFDEFGSFSDQLAKACYNDDAGNIQMTSCAAGALPSLDSSLSCEAAVESKRDEILQTIRNRQISSSFMFLPHERTMTQFCTDVTHNSHAPTMHNIMCFGQSISNVLNQHPDFVGSKFQQNEEQINQKQIPDTSFTVIRHVGGAPLLKGYVFLIEDSPLMKEQNRQRYIKQQLATIVSLLPKESWVGVLKFQGGVTGGETFRNLMADTSRVEVINFLPDVNTPTISEGLNASGIHQLLQQAERNSDIRRALDVVLTRISGWPEIAWHIFMITNSPAENIVQAKESIENSEASLSVITFEDSKDPTWTEMYKTANTRNIFNLPFNCGAASARDFCQSMSARILDEFSSTMREQMEPIYWHKLHDAIINSGEMHSFTLTQLPSNADLNEGKVFLTVLQDLTAVQISIITPSGRRCQFTPLHSYQYVLTLQNCPIEVGEWRLDLTNIPTNGPTSYFSVWISTDSSSVSSFNVKTSVGFDRTHRLSPNGGGVPVYVRVSDVLDKPVISADVEIEMFSATGNFAPCVTNALNDRGIDPDIVKNDGVYSGYIPTFSNEPAPHFGLAKVTTSSETAMKVTSINPSRASLLDSRFSNKFSGTNVPVFQNDNVGNARLTAIVQSFFSSETFNPDTLPPSRISDLTVTGESDSQISLEFTAPSAFAGRGWRVEKYQSCCSYRNKDSLIRSSCGDVTCVPVEPGTLQQCTLTRYDLYRVHIESNPGPVFPVTLQCNLRAVNSNGLEGPASRGSISVLIDVKDTVAEKSSKCESLSDDCLPLWVFWVMIGCLAGLLLICLLLILCWCLSSRKKKGGKQEVLMTRNKDPEPALRPKTKEETFRAERPVSAHELPPPPSLNSAESPQYNVFVNKAYIQDTEGGMKLVATDGQLLPLDGINSPDSSSEIVVLRSPYSKSSRNGGIHGINGNSNVAPVLPLARERSPNHEEIEDMTIYKPIRLGPTPPPKPGRPSVKAQIDQANPVVPVPRNRLPRSAQEAGYANSKTGPRQGFDDMPVYASVNRNGRRTPTAVSVSSPTSPNSEFSTFRLQKPTQVPQIPKHFGSSTLERNNPKRSSSPKRFDAFPSSDSEAYSDMSRDVAGNRVPPQPPPFPKNETSHPSNVRVPPSYRAPPNPPPPPPIPVKNYDEEDDDSEHWDDEDYDYKHPESYA